MSFWLWLHFTLPISLFTLRFGSLSQLTDVRQPVASPIWERAGGEGRQRRWLGSVAHAHTSTWLSMSGERDSVVDASFFLELTSRHREESSTKRSRAFLGWHRTRCHTRDRHVAQRSLSKTPTRRGDDEEESRVVRWLHSYFDGAQHERRAGFAENSKTLHS